MVEHNQLSPEDMTISIRRSGYLLEQRVESVLWEKELSVEANAPYVDRRTGIARELDMVAMKVEFLDTSDVNILIFKLLIECENNQQPIVFFTKDTIRSTISENSLKIVGIPVTIIRKVNKEDLTITLSEFLTMEKYHHYWSKRISTQYCSFQKNKQTKAWMATHQEEHHNTLTDLVVATESEIYETCERFKKIDFTSFSPFLIYFFYPILVLQGAMYEAYLEGHGNDLQLRDTNHIHFYKEVIAESRREQYHIDVVEESFLPSLIDTLKDEIKKTAKLMKKNENALKNSKEHIAKILTNKNSDINIRNTIVLKR